jgi:hypothetical protein
MQRIVHIEHGRQTVTCRAEPDPPLAFWIVEAPGQVPFRSDLRVQGNEEPDFFRRLAEMAAEAWGQTRS